MREYDPGNDEYMPQTNGLGTAGFVVSLIGLIACQPIAPVGLVMSAIAMRREPRGLAIAGLVVGLLGSVVLIGSIVALVVLGVAGVVGLLLGAGYVELLSDGGRIVKVTREYVEATGAPPTSLDQLALTEDEMTDYWGRPYRLRVVDTEGRDIRLYSDGPDQKSNTEDDVLYERHGVSTQIRMGSNAIEDPHAAPQAGQSGHHDESAAPAEDPHADDAAPEER